MKIKTLKAPFILLFAVMQIFSTVSISFAAEEENPTWQFGDVLYADENIAVFYGNPYEDENATRTVETHATYGLEYDQIWANSYTSKNQTISIPASSNNPLTYFTATQETDGDVQKSIIYVFRPDGSTCFIWDMGDSYFEARDRVIGAKVLPSKAYAWTSGSLTLRWNVETGSNGARMNLWAW